LLPEPPLFFDSGGELWFAARRPKRRPKGYALNTISLRTFHLAQFVSPDSRHEKSLFFSAN
jgi:hypothetical protein